MAALADWLGQGRGAGETGCDVAGRRVSLPHDVPSAWSGYVGIALLVALLGGTALTALLAARHTDSSYPRFLRSTNPSGLLVQPSTQLSEAEAKAFLGQIARLPHVKKVESSFALQAATLKPNGAWARSS